MVQSDNVFFQIDTELNVRAHCDVQQVEVMLQSVNLSAAFWHLPNSRLMNTFKWISCLSGIRWRRSQPCCSCVFQMLKRGREAYDEDIHYPLLITLTKGPQLSKPQ